ncbi:MAG: hypothetical protein ACRDHZ_08470, partial [Ktedonobacteraceae bacterium]
MTDHIAMNAHQPMLDEAGLLEAELLEAERLDTVLDTAPNLALLSTSSKPLHVRWARIISNTLSPAAISGPMILLVAFYQASSVTHALIYAAITLLFLSIGPFGYVLLNVH